MMISNKGILEIAEHEGIVPGPYLDSVKTWTYGIGHTAAAGLPDPATMQRGMPSDLTAELNMVLAVFRRDLELYCARVNKHVVIPLKQHEFDALVSFDFNTGGIWYKNKAGKMVNAVAIQKLNAGDAQGAADALMNWLRPPELRKRRTAERALFLTGDYDANGTDIPIWKVREDGRLDGRLTVIDGSELLEKMESPAVEDDPRVKWLSEMPEETLAWLNRRP